ncbi:MAG: nucleotidyltransferase family protein [Candidatus Dormibacteraceae bacterium]
MTDRQPLADVESEALHLVGAARANGFPVRILGGVAIAIIGREAIPERLRRAYADIDLAIKGEDGGRVRSLLTVLGYEADRAFNSLHGSRRLLFYDTVNGRRLDVFVSVFKMCHEFDLGGRLEIVPNTLSPSDLLLTKLQIVELNPKDLLDVMALLHICVVGHHPRADTIDLPRVELVTGSDWGWYTTVADNLARVATSAGEILAEHDAALVQSRAQAIRQAIERAPKSLGWKVRARVGRRLQWYELPEEVAL